MISYRSGTFQASQPDHPLLHG